MEQISSSSSTAKDVEKTSNKPKIITLRVMNHEVTTKSFFPWPYQHIIIIMSVFSIGVALSHINMTFTLLVYALCFLYAVLSKVVRHET